MATCIGYKAATATETTNDHSHRFSFVEGLGMRSALKIQIEATNLQDTDVCRVFQW